jgi:hypothetical protein
MTTDGGKKQDIFHIFECYRKHPAQRRFIHVLDLIRDMVQREVNAGNLQFDGPPPPEVYLGALTSLTLQRLLAKDIDWLPEFLRLLHVALAIAPLDSTIAGPLLAGLVPLFSNAPANLASELCPVCVLLTKHTPISAIQGEMLVIGLCNCSLDDEPKLRKAAGYAISHFPDAHQAVYGFLFANVARNPLRALTAIRNLASGVKAPVWERHVGNLLDFTSAPARDVRIMAFEILSVAIHYVPLDTCIQVLTRFAAERSDSSTEFMCTIAKFIQSGLARLAHEEDKGIFREHFPGILHQLLLFLIVRDEELDQLVKIIIIYGIHAYLSSDGDFRFLEPIVAELTAMLTVQYIGAWRIIFSILVTLPEALGDSTCAILHDPLVASIAKLGTPGTTHFRSIVDFIASCAKQVGLSAFFQQTKLGLNNPTFLQNVIIPILQMYHGQCPDDLQFVALELLPVERALYEDPPIETPFVWMNLWNALPNCVHTNMTNLSSFVDLICERLEAHCELVRPICEIVKVIAHHCGAFERLLVTLAKASVNKLNSLCIVPAISALAGAMDSGIINSFFIWLMHEKVIPFAADPDHIEVARPLVNVAMAFLPYLDEENRTIFYQILLSLAKQQSRIQKTALRALQQYLLSFSVSSAPADLSAILAEYTVSLSPSGVRHRLLLMEALLKLPGSDRAAMMGTFVPKFVAALKETRSKVHRVAASALLGIAADTISAQIPLMTLLSEIASGLWSESPSSVSASIDSLKLIIAPYFRSMGPGELSAICAVVWKVAETAGAKEIYWSALKFAKMLRGPVPQFVEAEQLPNILMLAVTCVKLKNRELKGKGRKMIRRCIKKFGTTVVTQAFPPGEEELLHSVMKKYKPKKPKAGQGEHPRIKLDARFDEDVHDLLDPGETIVEPPDLEDSDDFEFNEKRRLKLKDAPKRKTKAVRAAEDWDDEGPEILVRQIMEKDKKPMTLRTAAERTMTPRGRAELRRQPGIPASFSILSPKVLNKRNRKKMKAEYRKAFRDSK